MAQGNHAFSKSVVPSDVARNGVLENISIAAFQDMDGFIARKVAPSIGVKDQAFKYLVMDNASISQNKAAARAPGTKAEEGSMNMTFAPGLTEQFGYREKLPEELVATVDGVGGADMETTSTMSVAEVLAISDEVRFANAFFKTGVWARDIVGNASAGAGQYVFWSSSGSDPIGNILTELNTGQIASRKRANTLVLGANVLPKLLTNAQILARVLNGQRPGGAADPTQDDLSKLFKVDNVYVATAIMNTAKEGLAESNAFIIDPNSAWLGYVAPRPALNQLSAMYRFTWSGLTGNSDGLRNWKYYEQAVRSTWIEGCVDDTFKLISAKAGTFFSAIVQ
jgi:hypothetical protein